MTHQPPAPYNVPEVLHGTRFLVNGKLESWTGPSSEVRSPILSEDAHGAERTLLGSVPDLPAEEGIRALEAACDAYDLCASLGERCRHCTADAGTCACHASDLASDVEFARHLASISEMRPLRGIRSGRHAAPGGTEAG